MAIEYKLPYTASQIDAKLGKIDSLAEKTELPTKTSDLTNDSGFITEYTETDPTVPSWAKAAYKPTYTASEVGADASGTASSAVSAHNANTSAHADIREQITQLSSEKEALTEKINEIEEDVIGIKAESLQQVPLFVNSIEECTDTTKLYVLPDGYIYAWMLIEKEVESGSSYTNKLPQATDTDRTTIFGSDYDGDGDNDGYITGKRLSSSGGLSNESAACASGFIFPVAEGSVIRIKGATPIQSSAAAYVITYDSSNTKIGHAEMPKNSDKSDWSTSQSKSYYRYKDGVITVTLDSTFGTGYDAIRFSAGTISADTIVTINEEIKEGGGTTIVTEWAWTNTGRAFVAGEYEDRIIDLENTTAQHTKDIAALKKGGR